MNEIANVLSSDKADVPNVHMFPVSPRKLRPNHACLDLYAQHRGNVKSWLYVPVVCRIRSPTCLLLVWLQIRRWTSSRATRRIIGCGSAGSSLECARFWRIWIRPRWGDGCTHHGVNTVYPPRSLVPLFGMRAEGGDRGYRGVGESEGRRFVI